MLRGKEKISSKLHLSELCTIYSPVNLSEENMHTHQKETNK